MSTTQQTDGPLRRPSNSDRQYSTHVFVANPHSLAEPQQAHLSQRPPAEAFVTVRPSLGTCDSQLSNSDASSGLSIKSVEAPDAILDRARARGPGTYQYIRTEVHGAESSQESLDEKDVESPQESVDAKDESPQESVDEKNESFTTSSTDQSSSVAETSTTYQLSSVADYSNRIASKSNLDALVASYPLPETTTSKRWLNLRYGIFSTYRRLHALVLLANLIAISIMIDRVVRHPLSFTYEDATTAVAANLFVGTLMRHEHCINLLFGLCVALPHWLPLSIRRHAAKVYSYGGIHSACGISALLWYIFYAVLLVKQLQSQGTANWELQTLSALTALTLLVFIVLISMAYPGIRQRWHDAWEITHRFGGWLGVALVWAQLLLITIQIAHRNNIHNTGVFLIQQPAFWFLVLITLMIFYPWLRLRRLSYTPEQLSSHAIRLNFTNRNQKTCKGVRLSTSPMLENHGFATIPNPEGGFSVLASRAGDWTENLINNPPKYLWSRGAPTTGVARVAGLFKKVIIVATGSGIGPCMSWLVNNPNPGRLVWSARLPEQTYGPKLMGEVFAADEKALVIDSKVTGREPALLNVVFAVYKEVGAEAVIIISNPKVTRQVVFGLESRGVPAYGAIFDS